ncbi:MAG: carboxypeptidase-like regulatory domain-containing protein [Saprospiraceae bacterium]|nr:carboxypeptidase-like regulatory domain-containing protein [Saprospiraceae bacterium]
MKLQKITYTIFIIVILSLPFNIIYAQTTGSIQGVIKDEVADEGLPFVLIKFLQDGRLIAGTDSDFDGNYSLKNIEAGTYDIVLSYLGFPVTTYKSVPIQIGRVHSIDLELPNPLAEGIEVKDSITIVYKNPIIEQDNIESGQTLGAEDIDRMTTRDISAIAAPMYNIDYSDESLTPRKIKKIHRRYMRDFRRQNSKRN